jgi:hypothetical protein
VTSRPCGGRAIAVTPGELFKMKAGITSGRCNIGARPQRLPLSIAATSPTGVWRIKLWNELVKEPPILMSYLSHGQLWLALRLGYASNIAQGQAT